MEVGASGVTDLVNPYWLWNSGFSLSVPL